MKKRILVLVVMALNTPCNATALAKRIRCEKRFLPGEVAEVVKSRPPTQLRAGVQAVFLVQEGETAKVYILRHRESEWVEQPATSHFIATQGTLLLTKSFDVQEDEGPVDLAARPKVPDPLLIAGICQDIVHEPKRLLEGNLTT